jgi:general secretion pathway protein G
MSHKQGGFTLLELLAVVTILGIIAAMVVARAMFSGDAVKQSVVEHHKGTIDATIERYYLEQGAWPANDLSDIGADLNYFPNGIPVNPVDGAPYALDPVTHRVNYRIRVKSQAPDRHLIVTLIEIADHSLNCGIRALNPRTLAT